MIRGRLVLAFFIVGSALAGCSTDVGPCDLPGALEVVYLDTGIGGRDDNGIPMVAGQALVRTSCSGNATCHASDADGASRFGVPHGLDFDLGLRCMDADCLASDDALDRGQAVVLAHAARILRELDRGSMPPGAVGRAVLADAANAYRLDPAAIGRIRERAAAMPDVGVALPAITTREGREIIRNWLACGAPVVERTEAPIGFEPGTPCASPTSVGLCVHRVVVAAIAPEPTFESIYEDYLRPSCTGCHGGGPLDRRAESGLDLGTIDLAYDALLAPASGDRCGGAGARIVPFDSERSLLLDKLGSAPACGGPMAGARGAAPEVLDAIRRWIDGGASR